MSSPDPSLTSHSLLAALDTVGDNYLDGVLNIPQGKSREMKSREEKIKYYINFHPNAGWNHLAGKLLSWEPQTALKKVKGNITADKGRCVHTRTHSTMYPPLPECPHFKIHFSKLRTRSL